MTTYIHKGKILFKDWKIKNYYELGIKYKKTFKKLLKEQNCGYYKGYFIDLCGYDDAILPKIVLLGSKSYLRLVMKEDKIKCVAIGMIFK